jgi:chemotaxis protein methyltransferase WspC
MVEKNEDIVQEKLEKAQFYILSQKYSEALKMLKDVVETEDANPHAYYLYGLALEGSNNREEAREYFRRVLELDPDHTEAREHLDRLIGD